jgi:hypothetical protein
MRIFLALMVTMTLACNCKHDDTATKGPTGTPEKEAKAEAKASDEAPVAPKKEKERYTFEGEAANAKLSAMVHNDKSMVYCIEMQEWPDDVVGQKVKVTGILETTDQFKAKVDKDGAISQGSAGGDRVLRDVQWELVK